MIDVNQRQLVFIRSKSPLKEQIPESNSVFKVVNSGEWPAIRTADTIMIPFSVPHENQSNFYGRFQRDKTLREWAAFVEVLEIGADIASAPPILKSPSSEGRIVEFEEEFDEDDSFGRREDFEYRNSSWLETILNSTPATNAPAFGRKMLMIVTDENLEEKESERVREKVRKSLGVETKGVWHGRGFLGLCFVNSLSTSSIIGKLGYLFDRQELKDCLLVQPMDVILPNESGLSPLSEWVEHGYLEASGNVAILNRKTSKSARKVEVVLRHARRPRN